MHQTLNSGKIKMNLEKTVIPLGLKIKEELKAGSIYYNFDKPIVMPYDKSLLKKLESGENLSVDYFFDVLKNLVEDVLPEIFPKGYYDKVIGDDSSLRRCVVNPGPQDDYQYSFNMDFHKENLRKNVSSVPLYKFMNIQTSVFISSKIFSPGANDLIDNGFFPRYEKGILQPIEGLEIRPHTIIELPHVLYDNECVYISQLSTPIVKGLLFRTPLFFPEFPKDSSIIGDRCFCSRIRANTVFELPNSLPETIKQGGIIRDYLCKFMVENASKLKEIAESFADAKREAGIPVENSFNNCNPDFLYEHFYKVNRKIEDLRKKLPSKLISNVFYKSEKEFYDNEKEFENIKTKKDSTGNL